MKLNYLNKYIKQAIKHPHLIKDVIYKKHLSIILLCNIQDYIKFTRDNKIKDECECKVKLSNNIYKISNYYQKMGRSSITKEKTKEWLASGYHCWIATIDDKVVGGLWMFFGQIETNPRSTGALSKNKLIKFNKDVGYQGYVLIDRKYRGQGIYSLLNDHIMNHYYNEENIKDILLITGASNGAVIRTIMNSYGRLIGIVETKNILWKTLRDEIFIDAKEKAWE